MLSKNAGGYCFVDYFIKIIATCDCNDPDSNPTPHDVRLKHAFTRCSDAYVSVSPNWGIQGFGTKHVALGDAVE